MADQTCHKCTQWGDLRVEPAVKSNFVVTTALGIKQNSNIGNRKNNNIDFSANGKLGC